MAKSRENEDNATQVNNTYQQHPNHCHSYRQKDSTTYFYRNGKKYERYAVKKVCS